MLVLNDELQQTIILKEQINEQINWEINQDKQLLIIDFTPNSKLDFKINILKGKLKINYFILASKNEVKDVNYHANNIKPNTQMNIKVKVIQFDESQVNFKCVGEISKDAREAKSHQRLDFLTFSTKTQSGNHPILIINNNQVEAGHAGTVGQLDDKYLFYLMSRGISRQEALKLILKSYIKEIITDEQIYNLVNQEIQAKYTGVKNVKL